MSEIVFGPPLQQMPFWTKNIYTQTSVNLRWSNYYHYRGPWVQLMRDDKLTSPLIPIHSASSKLSQAAKCFTLLCYPFQVL